MHRARTGSIAARAASLRAGAGSGRAARWWLLAAAGLAVRAAAWALDPNPLLYGDSGSYLSAALDPRPYVIQPKGVSLLWRAAGVHVGSIVAVHMLLTVAIAWAAWRMSRRFWVVAVIVLSPLTIAYERTLLSEHLFTALLAVGVALMLRRNPLAGLALGAAAVTRTVGVVMLVPLAVAFGRRGRLLLPALALFVVVAGLYVARYVEPATGARTLAFAGPNALTVVAPIVRCPPAPADVCRWRTAHPNAIVFAVDGPVQTRIRALGWKRADAQLRGIVFRAIRDDPLGYARGYLGRIPHLFSLSFNFDHGGPGTVYGPSARILERIEGRADRPAKDSAAGVWWRRAIHATTVAAGVVVVLALLGPIPAPVALTIVGILLGSIVFNDATGRFLYPATPLALAYVAGPGGIAAVWRTRLARKNRTTRVKAGRSSPA